MTQPHLVCSHCNHQFNNEFYYQKHQILKEDNFIKFFDSLDELKFNFVYVHIPKNGGTTIRYKMKKLFDCLIIGDPNSIQGTREVININHTPFRNYIHPQKLICFARNPLSRCFSMFFYHKLHKKFHDFNDFINQIYNSKETVQYIQDSTYTNKDIQLPLLKTPRGTNIAFSWKCQSSWIPDDIFFLGKLENIEEDIERFCKKMNCPYHYIKLHVNKNPYSSSKKDITEETKTRVYELYKEDYIRFDYSI
jgi:hypothetical protein